MFHLFYLGSSLVDYSLSGTEMTISGEGKITQNGIRNKGVYTQYTKIVIEEGPSEIEEFAFYSCESLQEISIPASVSTIGERPFRACKSLTKISVSPSNPNYSVEKDCLYKKSPKELIRVPIRQNIIIPEGAVTICDDAFNNMKSMNFGDIVFPTTVTNLMHSSLFSAEFKTIKFASGSTLKTFDGFIYSKAEKIIIPKSVDTIASYAFIDSTVGVLEFETGSVLSIILTNTFSKITTNEICLPDSVTELKEKAFSQAIVIKISIGPNCLIIASSAFAGCNKLTEVIIREGNKNYASKGGLIMNKAETVVIFIPSGKETINIGAKVQEIGLTALQSVENLKTITVNSGNSKYAAKEGILYTVDFSELIAVCGGVKNVNVHKNVQTINDYAAYGCKAIETVVFETKIIKIIGSFSFAKSHIITFTLPDSVTAINSYAFSETYSLTTFNIKESSQLKDVGSFAFQSSSLISIYLGKSITNLATSVFINCQSLKSISFHPEINLTKFGNSAFVKTGLINFALPKTIDSISQECFKSSSSLETISFVGNTVLTTIGSDAFNDCGSLKEISLPDSCESIGIKSFSGCYSLKSFKNNLKIISSSSFENCSSLESFNFSSRQTLFEPGVFFGCTNIKVFSVAQGNSVIKSGINAVFSQDMSRLIAFPPGQEYAVIPPSTSAFADNAFAYSSKLISVAFYSECKLETIGKSAFLNCNALKIVQFPGTLRTIKSKAFSGCSSLKKISFPVLLSKIEPEAFYDCPLVSVKYCGTNAINGENVFNNPLKIAVTDLYPQNAKFCGVEAIRMLTVDCELMFQNCITCNPMKYFDHRVLCAFAPIFLLTIRS